MPSATSTPANTPRSAASSTQAPRSAAAPGGTLAAAAALALIALAAWAYLVGLARHMSAMPAMTTPHARPWTPSDVAFAFLMWSVMMAAMMTPSAAPMVLTYQRLSRSARTSAAFLGAYLAVWAAFSVGATALQALLQRVGMMQPASMRVAPLAGALLFLVAGVWQLTPLRAACLAKCRSPVSFLMSEWRDGVRGAFVMGTRHGAWCVACCWALMLLLFAVGVMSLLWVAAIAAFVLLEKTTDARWLGRAGGVLAIAWGAWLALS